MWRRIGENKKLNYGTGAFKNILTDGPQVFELAKRTIIYWHTDNSKVTNENETINISNGKWLC
jgi:hypothetical protein